VEQGKGSIEELGDEGSMEVETGEASTIEESVGQNAGTCHSCA